MYPQKGLTSRTAPYATSDKASFAYISARDRWPVILVSYTTETAPFSPARPLMIKDRGN